MLEIELGELLSRHGLSQEDFEKCGITWSELQEIVSHHQGQMQYLKRLGNFIADGLRDLPEVHSVRMRVKDPEHLAAKIIRKRTPDRLISIDNYEEEITDLIGVRVLHLYKEQWRSIHEHIEDTLKPYEKRANIRKGDPEAWKSEYEGAGLEVDEKTEEKGCYRSIHYTITSQPLLGRSHRIEIQVRTIFEEAWGEIDHVVNYPVRSKDTYLKNNLTMLNRLAGLGDELGSFTFTLHEHLVKLSEQGHQYNEILYDAENRIYSLSEQIKTHKHENEIFLAQVKDLVTSSSAQEHEKRNILSVVSDMVSQDNVYKSMIDTSNYARNKVHSLGEWHKNLTDLQYQFDAEFKQNDDEEG